MRIVYLFRQFGTCVLYVNYHNYALHMACVAGLGNYRKLMITNEKVFP